MAVFLEAFREDKKRLKVHTGPWGAALDRGVGLVIGYGPSILPAQFRYQIQKVRLPDEDDLTEEEAQEIKEHWKSDPVNGGGYFITSKQSKMMALALWGLISVEEGKRDDWRLMSSTEREWVEAREDRLYSPPFPEQVIEVWEELAAWMAISGGFRIW